jgi:hypothetical protein
MGLHALERLGNRGQFFIMPHRRFALVGPLVSSRRVIHTAGHPIKPEDMLPTPDVLLIVDDGKGDCMLFRYTAHGELAGDTPHDSAAEAQEEAESEYGEAVLSWMEVPEEIEDAHDFAIQFANDRLNQRD